MPVTQPIEAHVTAVATRLGDASVAAAGSTGVFFNIAPQSKALPYVIFQIQAARDENDHSLDSMNGLWTIKALSNNAIQAAQIHAACDALFHKYNLTVSGWNTFWLRREEWVSYAEVDASGQVTYHVGAMYRHRTERTS